MKLAVSISNNAKINEINQWCAIVTREPFLARRMAKAMSRE